MAKSPKSIQPSKSLPVIEPHCAAIDVGATRQFACVPADRDDQCVREFLSFTDAIYEMADWFKRCGIKTVVMESTGVYWIPIYEILESRGFKVHLVNARHVKYLPGRKSDVMDCQWLQQLMSFGLLRGAFRPNEQICALRALWRHRDMLLSDQGRHVQRMQKVLTQMNVQLHNVISDIMGHTGQAILRAIVAGERDGATLAKLRDRRIKADHLTIERSLQGNWRAEHLFCLKQIISLVDAIAEQVRQCDQQLMSMLIELHAHELPEQGMPKHKRSSKQKNAPAFDMRASLYQVCGVDLTTIPGVDVNTVAKIISEIGADLSRFPTVKHFTSWLSLCPGTKISGGKVLSSATKPSANRAAQALRLAAGNLRQSQSSLGAYFRRLCAKMDKPKAITAAAHKLARLVYMMLTKGQGYTDAGQQYYEERYRQRVVANLARRAKDLGLQLVPVENPA
jgi:transposase